MPTVCLHIRFLFLHMRELVTEEHCSYWASTLPESSIASPRETGSAHSVPLQSINRNGLVW